MAGLNDLLSWMDNKRRVVGRNLSDLVNNPQDYLTVVANELPNTVREYAADPMNFVGGGIGKIAYHGSPHKFDKFSLDKIGTGEGAQAYGHGLYLAESPTVAAGYKETLSARVKDRLTIDGKVVDPDSMLGRAAEDVPRIGLQATLQKIDDNIKFNEKYAPDMAEMYRGIREKIASLDPSRVSVKEGALYKVDIPDEAVARFLDWDKPLSQQPQAFKDAVSAREQQRMMPILEQRRATLAGLPQGAENASILKKQIAILEDEITQPQAVPNMTGGEYFNYLRNREMAPAEQADWLRKAGIPGIRYLDGGSRSAGQGTSNFVVFDPEMIRILERNGQSTGLQPWQPGEWRPINDLLNVRTD